MKETCPRCGVTVPTGRLGACPRCLLKEDAPPPVLGGTLELFEEIGRGGMGSVFRARHIRLNRTVAVKFLPDAMAREPEFKMRFEREARALALLNHPNIVSVYDFGQEGDQSYIVMEFVEGGPLSKRMPLPLEKALEAGVQVCDALAYAHRQGVVHRDIKPENILMDQSGRVKVTDFGIARIVRADATVQAVTTPDVTVGTPQYMAPETMHGAPPDPRMDIYSFGVVLYQMISGRMPVGHFDPLPGPVDRIVRKALAPEPARRYASADEMGRELSGLLSRPTTRDELDPDEMTWIRVVAVLQAISTAVAIYAFLACVTPKVMSKGELSLFSSVITEKLDEDRVVSRARFEVWWALATILTFAVAIIPYGLLRRHWRRTGLQRNEPNRSVAETRRVFLLGVVALAVYGLRRLLQARGFTGAATYVHFLGYLIEVVVLFFFWVSILQAWRLSRPLRREPLLWLGFALALLPPVHQLAEILSNWQP